MSFKHILKYGVKGGVMAAVLNLIIFEIALRLFGLDFSVAVGGEASGVNELNVILASFLPALVAAVLYFGLDRTTAKPDRYFRVIAAVVLVASLYLPFNAAEATTTALALSLMHIVAAFEITKALTHDSAKVKVRRGGAD